MNPTPNDQNGLSADEALAMLQMIAVQGRWAEARVEPAPLLSSTATTTLFLFCFILSVCIRRLTRGRQ